MLSTSHWISLLEPLSQALHSTHSEMKLRRDPLKEKVWWKVFQQTHGRAQLCGFVQLCQSLSAVLTHLSKESQPADFPGMQKCISPRLKFRFVQMEEVLGEGGWAGRQLSRVVLLVNSWLPAGLKLRGGGRRPSKQPGTSQLQTQIWKSRPNTALRAPYACNEKIKIKCSGTKPKSEPIIGTIKQSVEQGWCKKT